VRSVLYREIRPAPVALLLDLIMATLAGGNKRNAGDMEAGSSGRGGDDALWCASFTVRCACTQQTAAAWPWHGLDSTPAGIQAGRQQARSLGTMPQLMDALHACATPAWEHTLCCSHADANAHAGAVPVC
jgi:hypothetical protein